jgi:NAD(P)H dehydrogenase (quinone)
MTSILIIYDTNGGNTRHMAQKIARGVDSVTGCEAVIRSVPKVSEISAASESAVPEDGAPYADVSMLGAHDGLIIGSPTHFGNMSASLKYFFDQSTSSWISGALAGKPAAAFTSTGSMHGGQESTLLTMMMPLLHHGMLICGLPYSHPGLMTTIHGGTPYGASHVSGESGTRPLDETETALCQLLGKRVATIAMQLKA